MTLHATTGGPGQHTAATGRPQVPAGPDVPPAAREGLLEFQLNRLIGEILAQPGLDPDTRTSLLDHLARNPGQPGQALLAHLNGIHDPDDLPLFKPRERPHKEHPYSVHVRPTRPAPVEALPGGPGVCLPFDEAADWGRARPGVR